MIRFFLLFLFSFSLNCLAIEAHKAEYILSLYESTQSSGIYGIDGKSIYTLKEECSGWDSKEDLMVNFQLQDNVESKLISKWATFETFSGTSYQFDLTEKINDQNVEVPGMKDVILSPNIYIPLIAFFALILITIIFRKFYFKN